MNTDKGQILKFSGSEGDPRQENYVPEDVFIFTKTTAPFIEHQPSVYTEYSTNTNSTRRTSSQLKYNNSQNCSVKTPNGLAYTKTQDMLCEADEIDFDNNSNNNNNEIKNNLTKKRVNRRETLHVNVLPCDQRQAPKQEKVNKNKTILKALSEATAKDTLKSDLETINQDIENETFFELNYKKPELSRTRRIENNYEDPVVLRKRPSLQRTPAIMPDGAVMLDERQN